MNLFAAHFIFFLLNVLALIFIYVRSSKKMMPGLFLSSVGIAIVFWGFGTFQAIFFLFYFSIPWISRALISKYPESEEEVIRLNNTTLILLVLGLLINSLFAEKQVLLPPDIQTLLA